MTVWFKDKGTKISYIAFDRESISPKYRWNIHNQLSVCISSLYSEEVIYGTGRATEFDNLAKVKLKDNIEYDIFKITSYRIDFDPLFLKNIYPMKYLDILNLLSKELGSNIIDIYTSYDFGEGISFYSEFKKQDEGHRHAVFYVLTDKSIEYIPENKYPEPVLKDSNKLNIYKQFVMNSLISEMEGIGIKYDGTSSNISETFTYKNTNTLTFDFGYRSNLYNEIKRVLDEMFPIILEKMYDGKFKKFIEDYHINEKSIRKMIDISNNGHVEIDISNLKGG